MNNLHKLVPCRSKCKKLSKEAFKDTALVWFQVPETSFEDSSWVLESRARLEAWDIDMSKEEYYPAPTAQEFMDKMQDYFVRVGSNLGDYLAQWVVKSDSRAYWGHGKTPVIALYNCYLQKLEKEGK